MTMMRRALLVLVVTAGILSAPAPARACSCAPTAPAESLGRVPAAFVGTFEARVGRSFRLEGSSSNRYRLVAVLDDGPEMTAVPSRETVVTAPGPTVPPATLGPEAVPAATSVDLRWVAAVAGACVVLASGAGVALALYRRDGRG